MATQATQIASNTAGLNQLSGLGQSVTQIQNTVGVNSQAITSNTNRLIQAETSIANNSFAIGNNTLAIANNGSRITNIEQSLLTQIEGVQTAISGASIALAMPDAYLNPHENFAIAGGVSAFGNQNGIAFNMIARGRRGWSFGAGAGTAGGEIGGKLQARWGTR